MRVAGHAGAEHSKGRSGRVVLSCHGEELDAEPGPGEAPEAAALVQPLGPAVLGNRARAAAVPEWRATRVSGSSRRA